MTKSKKRTHVSFSEMYISFWLRIDYIIKKLKSSSFACIFPDNENCRVIFVAEIIGPVSSLAISTAAESSSRFLFSLSHHESCLSLTQLHMDYASHHWHIAERLQKLSAGCEYSAAQRFQVKLCTSLQDMTAVAAICILYVPLVQDEW